MLSPLPGTVSIVNPIARVESVVWGEARSRPAYGDRGGGRGGGVVVEQAELVPVGVTPELAWSEGVQAGD